MSTLVSIGRIGRPHGVTGETYLDHCPLDPAQLEALGPLTWRRRGEGDRVLRVDAVRHAVPRLLVRFEGFATREQVAELTNGEVLVDRATLPDAGPGVAYAFQLVGLEVRTVEGRRLGTVADVLMPGPHAIYVVHGEGGREILVPVVEPVVRRVDLEAGLVTVDLPPGLEEL